MATCGISIRSLSDILISVEHVGVTAIRGLVAKLVIDIDVVIAAATPMRLASTAN